MWQGQSSCAMLLAAAYLMAANALESSQLLRTDNSLLSQVEDESSSPSKERYDFTEDPPSSKSVKRKSRKGKKRRFDKAGQEEENIMFDIMDTNQDGLISPEEWKVGAVKMGIPASDIDRIFKDMDSNHGEATPHHLSKAEFFQYMDYEVPLFVTWADGYGDIDPFGTAHKEFNELPHAPKAAVATQPKDPPQVFVRSQRMPPMKWQVARALADSKPTGQAVQKFLKDTAEAKEAPVKGKFMSPKEVKKHHDVAVHRHPLTEHAQKENHNGQHAQKENHNGQNKTKKLKGGKKYHGK